MTKDEVVALMLSSRSAKEWDDNCDKVKKAFDGNYPPFWFKEILQSGLARGIMATFGADPDFKIVTTDKDGNVQTKVVRNDAAK